MFLRRRVKRLEGEVRSLERSLEYMSSSYRELSRRHERLMGYLGLHEHRRMGIEIRKNEEAGLGNE